MFSNVFLLLLQHTYPGLQKRNSNIHWEVHKPFSLNEKIYIPSMLNNEFKNKNKVRNCRLKK
jgi:hypothetical protein